VSSIGGWLGDGAAIITAGLCVLLMRFGHHLPAATHPWLHRLVILGMYSAGAVFVITTVGTWLIGIARRIGGITGGTAPGTGIGWAMVTLGALFLAATILVALVWQPDISVAYVAVAAPLLLALAPGGIAHSIYVFTTAPAQSLVSQLATWAGG
jgi:hypothetical protein